ncbi:unnamed protein product [Ilex paraguariensis]|uniref:C3H1-type domain-containing protein n=1 Tax=Ilex paraguariensis TaxID=185542 RepID=A0ABC8RIW3_9AQUA
MDDGRETGFSNENVVRIVPGTPGKGGVENWDPGSTDQAVWATEDDYRAWNREASVDTVSNSNYDGWQSQSRSGSEPPNKKSRNSQSGDSGSSNRSKAIGKMFFKTKLCSKFQAGTCPYISNCNFAHSIEELRRPPPNWQEIVAAHEEERGVSSELREEFQIPSFASGFVGETQRCYKGRHCKKFYTEEGCPYGDNCTFLHDEQSRARESVAISLGPGPGGGQIGGGSCGSNLKPSNWKTRICNKWEMTGYCPFGSKCHFAHGSAELHRYGGGVMEGEVKDFSASLDQKQGMLLPSRTSSDNTVPPLTSVPHLDSYHVGVPPQRLSNVIPKVGQRPHQKWKGPDKISKIYGDWIDDIE